MAMHTLFREQRKKVEFDGDVVKDGIQLSEFIGEKILHELGDPEAMMTKNRERLSATIPRLGGLLYTTTYYLAVPEYLDGDKGATPLVLAAGHFDHCKCPNCHRMSMSLNMLRDNITSLRNGFVTLGDKKIVSSYAFQEKVSLVLAEILEKVQKQDTAMHILALIVAHNDATKLLHRTRAMISDGGRAFAQIFDKTMRFSEASYKDYLNMQEDGDLATLVRGTLARVFL